MEGYRAASSFTGPLFELLKTFPFRGFHGQTSNISSHGWHFFSLLIKSWLSYQRAQKLFKVKTKQNKSTTLCYLENQHSQGQGCESNVHKQNLSHTHT